MASNAALAEYLDGLPVELRFEPRDPQGLARVLAGLGAAGRVQLAAAGAELRRRVEEGHSLDSWADRTLEAIRGIG